MIPTTTNTTTNTTENSAQEKTIKHKGRRAPILINDMKEHFECNLILIHSLETLDEMKIFQDVNGKMGNKKGNNNHDDLVISVAMAIQAMKQNKYYVAI